MLADRFSLSRIVKRSRKGSAASVSPGRTAPLAPLANQPHKATVSSIWGDDDQESTPKRYAQFADLARLGLRWAVPRNGCHWRRSRHPRLPLMSPEPDFRENLDGLVTDLQSKLDDDVLV